MSGIQVHSSDPINPAIAAKATAITPQKAYAPTQSTPYQPSTTTSSSSQSSTYKPAQPGQAIPAPTSTSTPPSNQGPPAPQPGAVPQPAPPTTTAKATLPPPPKAGEAIQPASYYAPTPTAVPSLPQAYPPQMFQPPLQSNSMNGGVPPHSTTDTASTSSHQPIQLPTALPTSEDPSAATKASLEHPPGYVQNQFATDMTPEQRFANEQQGRRDNASAPLEPVLGYVPNRSRSGSSASAVTGGDIWEGAKKYIGQVTEKVSEVEGKTWDWINGKN